MIPKWIIDYDYDKHIHQSSAGKAIRILLQHHEEQAKSLNLKSQSEPQQQ